MIVLYALGYTYLFYVAFVAVMGLYVGWKKAPTWVFGLLAPVAVVAMLMDLAFNYTLACVLFLQFPPSGCYTFTERISEYKHDDPSSWRGKLAGFICRNLLDPFQIGGHCS